jgi:hypothetical protein
MATVAFTSATKEKYAIEISDVAGQKVLSYRGVSSAGRNAVKLAIDKLPGGMYIVHLLDSSGERRSVKLLKQ